MDMLKQIILEANEKTLRLDVCINDNILMCDVFLISGGTERKLGCNLYSKISENLRNVLVDKKLPIKGTLGGVPAGLVVVLEGYNCIYLSYSDDEIVFYIADAKNSIIDKIHISKEKITEWNKKLCELIV